MLKAYALRLHRWIALIFAAPLLVLIVTGLILSVEPALIALSIQPESTNILTINDILHKADPAGQAKMLLINPYDNTLAVGGLRAKGLQRFDLTTGEPRAEPGQLTGFFGLCRRIHENFALNLGWLVSLSTFAMLILALLGLVMGLPRLIRNNASGWHKAAGWSLLPMALAIPLTGLILAFGKGSMPPPTADPPPNLHDAVEMVAREHDLSDLLSLRLRGAIMMAQINDDGFHKTYAVTTTEGLQRLPGNGARLLHEGTWGGLWSAALNAIASLAFLTLLMTGLMMWLRRPSRKHPPQRPQSGEAQSFGRSQPQRLAL